MNEIKVELNNWRDVPCSMIRRFNNVRMSVLPNLNYRFNVTKISANNFVDQQTDSKVYMERQKT